MNSFNIPQNEFYRLDYYIDKKTGSKDILIRIYKQNMKKCVCFPNLPFFSFGKLDVNHKLQVDNFTFTTMMACVSFASASDANSI